MLDQIDGVTEAMGQADVECFNNDVVHRQAWQQLRVLATEALSAFGWGETDVVPFVEIQPGIWHRPLSGS